MKTLTRSVAGGIIGLEEAVERVERIDLSMVKMKIMDKEEGKGWGQSHTEIVEIKYRRFLAMNMMFPDRKIVPSVELPTAPLEYSQNDNLSFLHHYLSSRRVVNFYVMIQTMSIQIDQKKTITFERFRYKSPNGMIEAYGVVPKSDFPMPVVLFCRGGNRDFGAIDERTATNLMLPLVHTL